MKWVIVALVGLAALAAAVVLRSGHRTVHGRRLVYTTAAPEPDARIVQSRLDTAHVPAVVTVEPGRIVIDLPGVTRERLPEIETLVSRGASLELHVVDDCAAPELGSCLAGGDHRGSVFMRRLTMALQSRPVPGITVDAEEWTAPDGEPHRDAYLHARDRDAITDLLRVAETADPTMVVPADHVVAFGHLGAGGWRTYYLEREVRLGGNAFAHARPAENPATHMPIIEIDLAPTVIKQFEEVTRARAGLRLAIVVDGIVYDAPVVGAPIGGGKLWITLRDPADQTELAIALEAGALPAPVALDSSADY